MLVFKNIIFISTLIYAGYCDYKTRIIPDKVHVIIILSSLFANFNLFQSVIGFILLPIPFIIPIFSNEDSVGGGDIKIVGSIGFFLGFKEGLIVVIIALTIAIVFSLLVLKKDKHDSFPLAPYLAIGCIMVLLF